MKNFSTIFCLICFSNLSGQQNIIKNKLIEIDKSVPIEFKSIGENIFRIKDGIFFQKLSLMKKL